MSPDGSEPTVTSAPQAPFDKDRTGQTPQDEERRLSIAGHLEELRRRIWVCLLAVMIAAAASFAWAGTIVEWLKRPAGPALQRLAFFSPPEAILAYMKVAVTAGLAIAMPLLLYQIWAFVRPGFTRREGRYGLAFVWFGSLLFLTGGAFAYWVLLPVSLQFLLGFGGEQLEAVISINQYLSFTMTIVLICGAVFQLPLVVFFLAKLGIVSPRTLRSKWRYALIIMVVAAALLTPTTDVATMLLMTVPMLALYEVSIWIASVAVRKRRRDD